MKKLMVSLMLIFFVLYASGQSDLFFHQTQAETDDLLFGMEINDAGDLYISGKSFGATGNWLNSWMYRIDEQGQKTDSLVFTDADVSMYQIECVESNQLLVFGLREVDGMNYREHVVFRTDASLNILEEKSFLTDAGDILTGLVRQEEGGAYVAAITVNTPTYPDVLFMRFSQSGDSLLYHRLNITGTDFVFDVLEKPDATGYYAFMASDSIFNNVLYTHECRVELTADFRPVEFRKLPSGMKGPYSAIRKNDSLYYLSSRIEENDGLNNDLQVGLMDTAQNLYDQNLFGEFHVDDYPVTRNAIVSTNEGKLYMAGMYNASTQFTYPNIFSEVALVKMDENMNLLWEKTYGGDAYYETRDMLCDNEQGVAIALGRYNKDVQTDEFDIAILRTDAEGDVLFVRDLFQHNKSVGLYPNPVSQHLNIDLPDDCFPQRIEIIDSRGKVLMNPDPNRSRADVSSLPAGYYQIRVAGKNAVYTQSFVKQ
ncbi:MAG: T9SS type A sorting domain-containing protein [Bacteroidales bacterium]